MHRHTRLVNGSRHYTINNHRVCIENAVGRGLCMCTYTAHTYRNVANRRHDVAHSVITTSDSLPHRFNTHTRDTSAKSLYSAHTRDRCVHVWCVRHGSSFIIAGTRYMCNVFVYGKQLKPNRTKTPPDFIQVFFLLLLMNVLRWNRISLGNKLCGFVESSIDPFAKAINTSRSQHFKQSLHNKCTANNSPPPTHPPSLYRIRI